MSARVSIDLTSDSDPETEPPLKRNKPSPPADPVPQGPGSESSQHQRPRLRAGFGYLKTKHISEDANRGIMGMTLPDLIDANARWVLVSNYKFDMAFLLSACPSLLTARHLVFVHGEYITPSRTARWESITLRQDSPLLDMYDQPEVLAMHRDLSASGHPSWVLTAPPQPLHWGTHHSKLFLVHCAAGVRVIVHTANFFYGELNNKTQGIWWQDFPPKDSQSPETSDFEDALAAYVVALKLDEQASRQARSLLGSHDFSAARAALVTSVPGKHTGSDTDKMGHMRVCKLLRECTFPAAFQGAPLVAQYSSVGYLTKPWLAEFGSSFSAGCDSSGGSLGLARTAEGAPDGLPHLVWPTVPEVRDSLEGWLAGDSISGAASNVYKDFMQPLYHRYGGQPTGRDRAMPHCKVYARYLSDGRLAWVMLASHNLSKAAWGEMQKSNFMVRSFEVGVLFLPDLELLYRQHRHHDYCCSTGLTLPAFAVPQTLGFKLGTTADVQQLPTDTTKEFIILPYSLPLNAYMPTYDLPWTSDGPHPGLDVHGCAFADARPSPYGRLQD